MALAGQVALVTGAGRGIGKVTAIQLAKADAYVAVADFDQDAADETSTQSGLEVDKAWQSERIMVTSPISMRWSAPL